MLLFQKSCHFYLNFKTFECTELVVLVAAFVEWLNQIGSPWARKNKDWGSKETNQLGCANQVYFAFRKWGCKRKSSVKQRIPGRLSLHEDSADPTARRKPAPEETKVAAEGWRNRKISAFSEKGEEIPVYPLGAPQTFGLQCICWKLLLLPPVLSFGTKLLKNMARQHRWFSCLDEHAALPVGKRRGFLVSEYTVFEQPRRDVPGALPADTHPTDRLFLPLLAHWRAAIHQAAPLAGGAGGEEIYADTMYAIMKTEDDTRISHKLMHFCWQAFCMIQ